jgi:hypothetical protein
MNSAKRTCFDGNGRQWAWDTRSVSLLKECPTKYNLEINEGYIPIRKSLDLYFGGLYARALEVYHRHLAQGEAFDDAVREAVRIALLNSYPWPYPAEDGVFKTRATLIRSIVWYTEQYKDDPCVTVRNAEGVPLVEYEGKIQIGKRNILVVHLDQVVDFAGRRYIQDQKTTKNTINDNYFNNYSPDIQMTQYTIVGQVAFRQSLEGIMLDVAQIAKGFTAFKRGFIYRSKNTLEEYIQELQFWLEPYYDAVRAADWPHNQASCFGCEFRKVCSADPSLREHYLKDGFRREYWNPLERRNATA